MLIALLKRNTPHEAVDPEAERAEAPDHDLLEALVDLPEVEFTQLIRRLLTSYGLEATSIQSHPEHTDVIAHWPQELIGGKYVLHFARPAGGEPIESKQLREFKEAVYEERALKGIFVTTGLFSQESRDYADHYGMEIVDGPRLLAILRNSQPAFVERLEEGAVEE
jgi:restriction endonuclease Mrr